MAVAAMEMNKMRTYCLLRICSETDSNLGATIRTKLGLKSNDVVDTRDPELIARRIKNAAISTNKELVQNIPRYFWTLSSQHFVDSVELQPHIEWLLDQVISGCYIKDLYAKGYQAYLSCFWEGNGRGGGPVLLPKLLCAVANHGIELRIDFYVDSD